MEEGGLERDGEKRRLCEKERSIAPIELLRGGERERVSRSSNGGFFVFAAATTVRCLCGMVKGNKHILTGLVR